MFFFSQEGQLIFVTFHSCKNTILFYLITANT